MKRTLLAAVCLIGMVSFCRAQTVSIEVNAGLLQNSLGTAVEPNGGLLQLLASPSGTFSAPTSTAYATGDNVLVASFAMNSNGGTAGLTVNDFTNLLLTTSGYTLTASEPLLLRFYPNLTFAGMPAAPTLATTFGQVRSNTAETGVTDASQTGWVVPAAGSTVDLDYLTVSAGNGGTYANVTAYATGIVLVGLVPEPSTYAMFACGFAGLIGMSVWNRRGKRSPAVA